VPAIDATGYHALEMLHTLCKKNHTALIILSLRDQPLNALAKYGFIDNLGAQNACDNVEEALVRADFLLKKANALVRLKNQTL